MMWLCHGRGWQPTQTASCIHIRRIQKGLITLICCPWAYSSSLKLLYPHYLACILRFWVTCGVKMMWLCHGRGWQPTQTASRIHIIHVKSVWAHWYAVHGHEVAALNSYTQLTWLIIWGSGSLVESKWCHYVMVLADSQLKLLPASTLDMYKLFELIYMLPMCIWQYLKQLYPAYLGHILQFWVIWMMSFRHGWGWQSTQTASHIHIRYIQSVWAHWYAVHGHTTLASNSYTQLTWLIIWGSGSLVESKWWHNVIVEADSLLKLLPSFALDMSKVFEHIDMLSMGIWPWPYTVIPILISSDFGVLDHLRLRSQSDGIMSFLRVTATSNCFPHPHNTYKSCLAHWYAVHIHTVAALYSSTHTSWIIFWGSFIFAKLCRDQTLVVIVSNSFMLSKSGTLLYC